jgi:obg-like ATPase 1
VTPQEEYFKSLGGKFRSQMPKIIRSGYNALKLINYFTVGQDEVRAWSIREGASLILVSPWNS